MDWRTIIVGAMREGGDQYYALDVTNPSGSIAPDLLTTLPYPGYLWEFPDEADTGSYQQWLGETWGKPVITKVKLNVDGAGPVERWVVIVSGGYHETADPNSEDVSGIFPEPYVAAGTNSRSVFMLDAKTGGVIAEHTFDSAATDAHADMKYAFVAPPAVLDLNSDGYADVAYFVDMGGQVFKWVFHDPGEDRVNDVDTSPPSSQPAWTFKLFFKAPTAGPYSGYTYYKNFFFPPAAAYSDGKLWLAFGSGERRSLAFAGVGGDPDTINTENNRYYVVSDIDPYELQSPAQATLLESDLADLTSDEDGATISGRGFYFRVANGEKFVTNTEIFAGHVVAASFTPTSTGDPCTSRGDGKLYVFDLKTGEGFFTDGGGNPTRGLDIGPGLPTDPQVSVGAGGEDNKLIIEKSGTDVEIIDEENIDIGGGLLYWREKL